MGNNTLSGLFIPALGSGSSGTRNEAAAGVKQNQPETAGPGKQVVVVSAEQIQEMIAREIAGLKVYVVESDITEAQNTIKAIVEQASF